MTPEQFAYWLKGFFEISEYETLSTKQIKIIKDHLDLVFNKQTPDRSTISELELAYEDLKKKMNLPIPKEFGDKGIIIPDYTIPNDLNKPLC
jgi:hypothetical protein